MGEAYAGLNPIAINPAAADPELFLETRWREDKSINKAVEELDNYLQHLEDHHIVLKQSRILLQRLKAVTDTEVQDIKRNVALIKEVVDAGRTNITFTAYFESRDEESSGKCNPTSYCSCTTEQSNGYYWHKEIYRTG